MKAKQIISIAAIFALLAGIAIAPNIAKSQSQGNRIGPPPPQFRSDHPDYRDNRSNRDNDEEQRLLKLLRDNSVSKNSSGRYEVGERTKAIVFEQKDSNGRYYFIVFDFERKTVSKVHQDYNGILNVSYKNYTR